MKEINMKILLFIAILINSFINIKLNADIKFKIYDLGTLQSDSSKAILVNEIGQIAGYYTWKNKIQPYFWDPTEGLMIIDVPKGCYFEIVCMYAKYGRILGILYNEKSKLPIGMYVWDRNSGLYGTTIRFKTAGTLKEIIGVTLGHKVIGVLKDRDDQEQYFFSYSAEAQNLPVLYGDLGLPIKITSILGATYHDGNDRNSIVVGNCLWPLVNKGENMGYIQKGIFWQVDQGWKVKPILSDPYISNLALAMNNNGQIICEAVESWFLIDLHKNTKQQMQKFTSVKSFNNKGFFLTNEMDLVEISMENGQLGKLLLNFSNPEFITNMDCGTWKKISSVNAINDTGYIIGEAETINGETHAMLLIPER